MKISHSDKALLITVTGASLLVLVFFFLGVKPYQGEIEEFIEIPVITEEIAEELQEQQEDQVPERRISKTNQAYNTAQLREENKSFQDDDEIRKAIEAQQQSSVEQLNDNNEAKLQALQEAREGDLEAKREEVQAAIDAREAARNKKKKSAYRQSTVSYDLVGRTAIVLPNPVYTCDAYGKIVVNITVNDKGTITSKNYNKSASTSTNGCLIDQAMEYLTRAYFDKGNKATQLGSVTFDFQG